MRSAFKCHTGDPPRGLTHNHVLQINVRDVGAWTHVATLDTL